MLPEIIKVFITDEHTVMREGLKELFLKNGNFEFCGESETANGALENIRKFETHLLLAEARLPDLPAAEFVRRLKKEHPNLKIIILTHLDNDFFLQELLEAGIDGFIIKNNSFSDILRAIRSAFDGNIFMSPEITKNLVRGHILKKQSESKSIFNLLTARENEILKLLVEGHSNHDIGKKLDISAYTAKKHRTNLMKKLDIHNLAELTRFAMKNGLL